MPKIARPLTAIEVKQLNKPGFHSVGTVAGLSLVIKRTGAKSWILRVKFGNQRSDLGLGAYPEVTLAAACEKARQRKELIRQGINPLHEQKTLKQAVLWTFKRCAEVYIESHKAEWTNAKHEAQWPSTLKKYVYPVFGDKPVKDVSQKDVLSVVQAEWLTKNVSMRRVLNRIESVLGWAAAMGYRSKENPATWKNNLDHLLAEPKKFVKKTHFKALPYSGMAALMKRLKSVEGFSARCLEFAILTASRSGEVRGCTWSEIDLEAAEWSIGAERMKGKRPHRIPLCPQALELLAGLPRLEGSDLVFPGRGQGQLSDMSLNAVLRRLAVPAVQHGFRSTFTDWAAEKTNHPSEVREMALAHAISNDTEASYAWRQSLKQAGGNTVALKPASKRPKRVREPVWCPQVMAELKRLRQITANLGKEKVFAKLVPFCQQHGLALPSVSTIGRMIASAPDKLRTSAWHTNARGQRKRFTRAAVTRKPKGVQLKPMECLAFDTIVRQRDGVKRYILTAIDPKIHLAFAYAPPTASSVHAAKLHEAITQTFPDYAKAKALTDNGSEFKGHFAKRMSAHEVMHWKTYPKTPKMNAHCERFNRSIQESFVDYYEDLLFTDLALFNQKMSDWLVFYNTELPHLSTKPNPKKTASLTNLPVAPIEFLLKLHPQSRMYWTNTTS